MSNQSTISLMFNSSFVFCGKIFSHETFLRNKHGLIDFVLRERLEYYIVKPRPSVWIESKLITKF